MKIFLDFDDCLFDTQAFYVELQNIFEGFGVSEELFKKSYQEIRAEFPPGGWCYSFDAHINRLQQNVSFDEESLRQKLAVFSTDTKKFLFPDVEDFLILLRENAFRIFILSFGDTEHQMAKISGTGISQFIERNIITDKDKGEALRSEIDDDEKDTWFFDDRMKYIESVKRAFPKIKTVLVRRKEGRWHDEPNDFCDYVVSDLKEACGILKSF